MTSPGVVSGNRLSLTEFDIQQCHKIVITVVSYTSFPLEEPKNPMEEIRCMKKTVNLLSPCPELMLFLGLRDVASILCCGMSWQLEATTCPAAKEKAD